MTPQRQPDRLCGNCVFRASGYYLQASWKSNLVLSINLTFSGAEPESTARATFSDPELNYEATKTDWPCLPVTWLTTHATLSGQGVQINWPDSVSLLRFVFEKPLPAFSTSLLRASTSQVAQLWFLQPPGRAGDDYEGWVTLLLLESVVAELSFSAWHTVSLCPVSSTKPIKQDTASTLQKFLESIGSDHTYTHTH